METYYPNLTVSMHIDQTPRQINFYMTAIPPIRKVIFNPPATIIYWDDDTKTVVKCGENDSWDAEKGLAMAVAKKAMGNKGNYNKALKRWLEDRSERSETTRSEMKATGG